MKASAFLDQFRTEGRLEGARALLLHVGRKKFGKAPTKKQHGELSAVTSLRRLERLSVRLLDVDSWDDLLAPR